MRRTRRPERLLPALALLVSAAVARAAAPAPPSFDRDVLPVFRAKCQRCHGEEPKGDLDVRTKTALLKGGESGPVLSPGSPEKSLLWVKVAADKMPPGKTKLTAAEKVLLRAWIEGGAPGADRTL